MSTIAKFFLDFLDPFFGGIVKIFKNIFEGLLEMFNVIKYGEIINKYSSSISGMEWILVILTVVFLIAFVALLIFLIVKAVKRFIRYKRSVVKQESMEEEIEDLNTEIVKLKLENQKFLEMSENEVEYDENGNIINKLKEGESRFFKLSKVDEDMKKYKAPTFNNTISLKDFCTSFKNFSASELKLYYDDKIIRLFISSFAATRLIILQGISGTGKTSLAYAFGNMIANETIITSVQPSWRDSSELFGYFNEFTKRFNETEVLAKMYEAGYNDEIYLTLLDEMNISRVEYYFAEMLSILELPVKEEWVIELVPNVWDKDPIKLDHGKLKIPGNMWYVGTINNDDSTFMVTDKVYDRAMPIEIDRKYDRFEAPKTAAIPLSSTYFQQLFKKAQQEHSMSQELLDKLAETDKYMIEKFRLSFGNRIVKQMKDFIPVYVACGGNEIEAVDYLFTYKILRKFEQLNLSYIREEIPAFIEFLGKEFGMENLVESKPFLERLEKSI